MQFQGSGCFNQRSLIVWALVSFWALSATACEVFPLDTGLYWTYLQSSGFTHTTQVIGTTTLNGTDVVETKSDYSPFGITTSYYSLEEDGDVLVHAIVSDQGEVIENLFSPPFKKIDCPLAVGKTWQSNTTIFDHLDGSGIGSPISYQFEVVAFEQVTTPAGDFMAYQVVTSSKGGGAEVRDWYAPGVGRIKNALGIGGGLDGGILTDQGVPVTSSNWGSLKALFW